MSRGALALAALAILVLLAALTPRVVREPSLGRGYAVFGDPSLAGAPAAVMGADDLREAFAREPDLLRHLSIARRVTELDYPVQPALALHRFERGGRTLWASPQLTVGSRADPAAHAFLELPPAPPPGAGPDEEVVRIAWRERPLARAAWFGGLLGAAALLLAAARAPRRPRALVLGMGACVLLRWGLLGGLLAISGDFQVLMGDEQSYFATAAAVLRGEAPVETIHPQGLGLLYAPFALAAGAESFEDVILPLSTFQAVVLGPLLVVLVAALARRWGRSPSVALLAAGIAAALPFFYRLTRFRIDERPEFLRTALDVPRSLPWPDWPTGSNTLWYQADFFGYSAVSDTLGALLALGVLWLLAGGARGRSPAWYAGLGLLFGAASIVRLALIFLAVPIALELARAWRAGGRDERGAALARGVAALAAAAALPIAWQLWVNWLQSGSPLHFPYDRHGIWESDRGFELARLAEGLRFFFSAHTAVLSLALYGAVRALRRDPLHPGVALFCTNLFFYCGFEAYSAGPVRFLLVNLLLAAIFLARLAAELVRAGAPGRVLGAVLLLGLAAVTTTTSAAEAATGDPSFPWTTFGWRPPVPDLWPWVAAGAVVAGAVWLARRDRALALGAGAAGAAALAAPWPLVAAAWAALAAWQAGLVVRALRRSAPDPARGSAA